MSDMEPSDGEHSDAPFLGNSDDDSDDDDANGFGAEDGMGKAIAPSDNDEDALDDDDDDDDKVPEAEEDDDDDDDDDDEKELPKKKQQHISKFYGAAHTKSTLAKRDNGAPPAKGKGKAKAAATSAAGKGVAKDKLLELGASDDDSDAELPTRDLVRKPLKLSATAADPFEEHDQLRRQYASGSQPKGDSDADSATIPPKVSARVRTCDNSFVVKNDKGPVSKRFYTLNAGVAALHAPNYKGTEECALSATVEVLMQSRKQREDMLTAMANDPAQFDAMVSEVQIHDVKMDATGSGGGPGIVNVAAYLPFRMEDAEAAVEGMYAQFLNTMDVQTPAGRVAPTFLLAVDDKLMKKIYKAGKSALPRLYDPNKSANVKYRVVAKMEEQAKLDANFEVVSPPAKAAKGKRKRGGGGGDAAAATTKKSKTVANGASSSSAATGDVADDEDDDDDAECGSQIKWTKVAGMAIEVAGISVAPGETVHVVSSGPGRFVLVKTSEA